ncbi:sepiapterin reductase [Stomoxys calcitrans]|uniref:sepiapterin reductase n=1 Tax=Stomoxys calcitrans TaxID=35570 RepID=UPI0027E3514C|nr:sepiapterin reductase [Stomoxys calcitrans]
MDLNKKTYFLITGASRGIGKSMALEIASKLKAGSVILLMARNLEALQKTKSEIESKRSDVTVQVISIDLSTAKAVQFQKIISGSLVQSQQEVSSFDRAFIIHNAGTLGDVTRKAQEMGETELWTQYYHTNVFATIALNVEFFKVFPTVPKLVVNISSLCSIEPFISMSLYCSGKAAREMYFKVLAVEEKDNDTLVLNYAPGAIDTDMTMIIQEDSFNLDLQDAFKTQRDNRTMLTTQQTAEKFIKVLEEVSFETGAHIDYYDYDCFDIVP